MQIEWVLVDRMQIVRELVGRSRRSQWMERERESRMQVSDVLRMACWPGLQMATRLMVGQTFLFVN